MSENPNREERGSNGDSDKRPLDRDFRPGGHVQHVLGRIYQVERRDGDAVYVHGSRTPFRARELTPVIVHRVESEKPWYATQCRRTVEIHEHGTERTLAVFEPAEQWAEGWGWKVTDSGGGIYFVER